jgi:hypothetical protein
MLCPILKSFISCLVRRISLIRYDNDTVSLAVAAEGVVGVESGATGVEETLEEEEELDELEEELADLISVSRVYDRTFSAYILGTN